LNRDTVQRNTIAKKEPFVSRVIFLDHPVYHCQSQFQMYFTSRKFREKNKTRNFRVNYIREWPTKSKFRVK